MISSTTPRAFPLTTRIHDGPASYAPGGGYGTWKLDLTNTTTRTCADIHPVVVLVDKERALKASQPRLEFYEGDRPRPVRLETTDEDELVGAFGGAGLTVGPGRTVTVKVRLALTSDAVPNEVTVNAAVVQRHDDDGDWVGQSNDYRFAIADDGTGGGTGGDTGTGTGTDPQQAGDRRRRPSVRRELARTGLGPAAASPPPPPRSSSSEPRSSGPTPPLTAQVPGDRRGQDHDFLIRLRGVGTPWFRRFQPVPAPSPGVRSTCLTASPSILGSPTWTACSSTRACRSPAPTPS
ncbi:hypothetical protein B1R27_37745 [Streptomyces sp. GKU 895]|nr:hypothetical protein B1R27_37745 [Streptomyces sp. GKU 895]